MYTEGIDMPKRGRYATLPEEVHQGVYSFRIVNMEVPKHVRIWNICLWMSFMTPIHAGELDGVPNEEDWQIVEDEILVTILSKELHSPSTYVTNGVT